MPGISKPAWEAGVAFEWKNWALPLRIEVEVPRRTKYTYHLWVVHFSFLCFHAAYARKHVERVPKQKPIAVEDATDA